VSAAAGYSGTPLAKKLGVREGQELLLIGAPAGWSVGGLPEGARTAAEAHEQDIRDIALPLGLVDVKVAALDRDWSGLRLVWRRERRATPKSGRG
jgi:hypothetical protein